VVGYIAKFASSPSKGQIIFGFVGPAARLGRGWSIKPDLLLRGLPRRIWSPLVKRLEHIQGYNPQIGPLGSRV